MSLLRLLVLTLLPLLQLILLLLLLILLIDDKQKERVPAGFPGETMVRDNEDEHDIHRYTLSETYRTENTEDIQYFFERIVGAIRSKHTNFRRRKSREKISDIFTASDEAYALLFLYNEYHCWTSTTAARTKKRFTNSKLGCKQGWNYTGRKLYQYLFNEVVERRRKASGTAFEIDLVKYYKETAAGGTGNSTESEQERRRREQRQRDESDWNVFDTCDKKSEIFKMMMEENSTTGSI